MSLKRAGLSSRLNNQPRFTGRRITLNRVSLRRFPFLSAPSTAVTANYVEDVFATYLYTGTGSTQSIPNNIRLGDGASSSGWVSTLASGRSDIATYGYSVAVDSSGNVYVSGLSNDSDFQLIKYNSSGVVQWQKTLGGSTQTAGFSVAVDGNDNVYVAGSTISGTDEAFLVKYNSSGTLQWQRTLGGTLSQTLNGVKVDSSGNAYVCGDVGSGGGGYDALVAKYDSSGVLQWQRILGLGGSSYNFAKSIAIDNSGNSYISGIVSVSGNYRILTAKYDTSGVLQWQRRLTGGSTDDRGQGVAVDGSGNVYICGFTNSVGDIDIIVAKYDSSGVIQWQRRTATSSTSQFAYDIAADSSGNVYVVGISDSYDFQIVKYNSSGVFQWQRALTFGSVSIYGESVTVDNNGLYVCGYAYLDNRYIALTAKLPTDGSGIGGYSVAGFTCQYKETLHSNSAFSLTNAASTLSNSAGALTNAASTLTEATGNLSSSLATINTGTGFGGLVWMKGRSTTTNHALYDTARGATFDLASNLTDAQTTQSNGLTAFTNNGFTIGGLGKLNTSAAAYTSWTFREQAKFFDVVTFTTSAAAAYTFNHNLGSTPGFVIIRATSVGGGWFCYHRSLGVNEYLLLNATAASGTITGNWAATSTTFTVPTDVLSGGTQTYVAYLFAHDAGGFGLSGSDNVISCGSFISSASGVTVNLGYEPQWLLIKNTSASDSWFILDTVRGFVPSPFDSPISNPYLSPNSTQGEVGLGTSINITSTGFYVGSYFGTGATVAYVAIRRGPMKTPTNGTEVFQPIVYTGTNVDNRQVITSIFTDMIMARQRNSTSFGGMLVGDRLRGNQYLATGTTAAGVTDADSLMTPTLISAVSYGNSFSAMNGFGVGNDATSQLNQSTVTNNHVVEAFRRAPGFLDIVTYTGTGSARTISHNLGVVPKMIWVKETSGAGDWTVYTSALGPNLSLQLDDGGAYSTLATFWNDTAPTSSSFTVGTNGSVNASGDSFVAYLFGDVPSVSKCSYYVGKGVGTSQQIDCGFTAGARLVLIKSTEGAGNWYLYDSSRGILSGNDPYFSIATTAAENTSTDYIDPYSAGFEISSTAPADMNSNYGESYVNYTVGGTAVEGVIFNDNQFVAVDTSGQVNFSPDGIRWTTYASGINDLRGITFGNGLYVVCATTGRILTSPNGTSWTSRTSGTTNNLLSCEYAFGKYWTCGNSGTLLSSPDGINWSSVTTGTTVTLGRIKYLNGVLFIVGSSSRLLTSSDGINFTLTNLGLGNTTLRDIAYGKNLYVIGGDSQTLLTSPDGTTWTSRTIGRSPQALVFTGDRFLAGGSTGTTAYSNDAITWTNGPTITAVTFNTAAIGNDIAILFNSTSCISSPRYIYWAIA
jgi:hypothetical protein